MFLTLLQSAIVDDEVEQPSWDGTTTLAPRSGAGYSRDRFDALMRDLAEKDRRRDRREREERKRRRDEVYAEKSLERGKVFEEALEAFEALELKTERDRRLMLQFGASEAIGSAGLMAELSAQAQMAAQAQDEEEVEMLLMAICQI